MSKAQLATITLDDKRIWSGECVLENEEERKRFIGMSLLMYAARIADDLDAVPQWDRNHSVALIKDEKTVGTLVIHFSEIPDHTLN